MPHIPQQGGSNKTGRVDRIDHWLGVAYIQLRYTYENIYNRAHTQVSFYSKNNLIQPFSSSMSLCLFFLCVVIKIEARVCWLFEQGLLSMKKPFECS